MTDHAAAVQALLDKQEITELLTRYLRSVDRGDVAWGIAHRQLLWDWNHDAPAAEHWMQGLLASDLSVLRMSAKFPADPIYPNARLALLVPCAPLASPTPPAAAGSPGWP